MTYKIVRNFFQGRHITIRRGLSLEEAQKHCKDPETSSTTCKKWRGKHRTKVNGMWFDGYTKE